MKKKYYTPLVVLCEINVEDVICVSSFEVKDENVIFDDIDVTLE